MTSMHYEDDQAEIHQLVVGPLDNNVYVLRCKQTGEAVLIDAANEHDKLLELCRRLGVIKVIETHGHWDHIQAVPQVREAGYEVGVTEADASMLPSYDFVLEDESVIQVGVFSCGHWPRPGTRPGRCVFTCRGRPCSSAATRSSRRRGHEVPRRGFPTIVASIENRIFRPFAAETIVMPGHGADTTVGAESPISRSGSTGAGNWTRARSVVAHVGRRARSSVLRANEYRRPARRNARPALGHRPGRAGRACPRRPPRPSLSRNLGRPYFASAPTSTGRSSASVARGWLPSQP